MADRFACAVEVATFLAIMNIGGSQQLLTANNLYEPIRTALCSLVQQCTDELEFILLLYAIGSDPIAYPQLQFPQWARTFLRARLRALAIDPARDHLLADFVQNRHDKTFRPINFGLLDRTRLVLTYSIPTHLHTLSTQTSIALKPEWRAWLLQEPRSLLAVAQFIAQNCPPATEYNISRYRLPEVW
jgi:hypothetical protein